MKKSYRKIIHSDNIYIIMYINMIYLIIIYNQNGLAQYKQYHLEQDYSIKVKHQHTFFN